jgi:hypothetical protein
MSDLTVMFRPCNQAELDLVEASGFTAWPPRLPIQPIFYPVTNLEYAREVNRWNVEQYGVGYITRFYVKREFAARFDLHVVGAGYQTEWWIPAEDLPELNANLIGKIEVIERVSRD